MEVSSKDSNILCDGDFYKGEVLPISLVFVVVLGFAVPLWIGFTMFRNYRNKQLETTKCLKKYGILYMAYTKKNYYWECITIFEVFLIFFVGYMYMIVYIYYLLIENIDCGYKYCVLEKSSFKRVIGLLNYIRVWVLKLRQMV